MSASDLVWSIVMPVKRLSSAKSRLDAPRPMRADLALAMALDTAAAALGCPGVAAVVAVTDDDRARPLLSGLGVVVVADEPDAGLNPALRHGAAHAVRRHPGSRVAALASDLPALAVGDLAVVLAAADDHRCGCVADASGEGTTVLTARTATDFDPRFGARSLARHRATGAVDLTAVAAPSVRRDVDTVDDLRAAVALGVGARTAEVLARSPLVLGRGAGPDRLS